MKLVSLLQHNNLTWNDRSNLSNPDKQTQAPFSHSRSRFTRMRGIIGKKRRLHFPFEVEKPMFPLKSCNGYRSYSLNNKKMLFFFFFLSSMVSLQPWKIHLMDKKKIQVCVIPTCLGFFFVSKSITDQKKKKCLLGLQFLWWFLPSVLNPVRFIAVMSTHFNERRTSFSKETLRNLWDDTWQSGYLQTPWDFGWISWHDTVYVLLNST